MKLILSTLSALTLAAAAQATGIAHDGVDRLMKEDLDLKPQELQSAADYERPMAGRVPRLRAGSKAEPNLVLYQVDLGYEIHQGFEMGKNNAAHISFTNIPYAKAPNTSETRWQPPNGILESSDFVNEGRHANICPQLQAGWVYKAFDFVEEWGSKDSLDDKWKNEISPDEYGTPDKSKLSANEDCLKLDVKVSRHAWDNRNKHDINPAPVIVWIHAGGYVTGWKDEYGGPEGFFEAAARNFPSDNIIYAAVNYRLGAFGFLGGEKFTSEGGVANIGLMDQEMALKWIENNIHLFGGDPKRITVMGQSAGASSILHHMSSRMHRPVFKRAIIQSPWLFPQLNTTQGDETYNEFLRLTNATGFDDLIKKDTEVLQRANEILTWKTMYGYFNFGPTVDHRYVWNTPRKDFSIGAFHNGISVLTGYTALDGLFFTPPWIRSSIDLRNYLQKLIPGVPDEVLDFVSENYMIIGSEKHKILGASHLFGDITTTCNVQYITEALLAAALENPMQDMRVYRYIFNTLPSLHDSDVGYTFYPSPPPPLSGEIDPNMAKRLQDMLIDFARYGDPNLPGSSFWPEYNANSRKIMNFGLAKQDTPNHDIYASTDPYLLAKKRCEYLQNAPYYKKLKEEILESAEGMDGATYEL